MIKDSDVQEFFYKNKIIKPDAKIIKRFKKFKKLDLYFVFVWVFDPILLTEDQSRKSINTLKTNTEILGFVSHYLEKKGETSLLKSILYFLRYEKTYREKASWYERGKSKYRRPQDKPSVNNLYSRGPKCSGPSGLPYSGMRWGKTPKSPSSISPTGNYTKDLSCYN